MTQQERRHDDGLYGAWKRWWRRSVEKAPVVLRIKRWIRQRTGSEPRSRIEVRCRKRERGGWWFCQDAIRKDDLVYSFGVGQDLRFELALVADHGARICTFDPTPSSLEWIGRQELPAGLCHIPLAVGAEDGELELYEPGSATTCHSLVRRVGQTGRSIRVPVRRLPSIMRELGHDRIDHLKLDVEGAEYSVIVDLIESDIRVRQLLVEFHHRFTAIGAGATTRALQALYEAGYRIFHISPDGQEYSFLGSELVADTR